MGRHRFERNLFASKDVELVVTDDGELVIQLSTRGDTCKPLILEVARIDDERAPRE